MCSPFQKILAMHEDFSHPLKNLKKDFPSSIVVFLVALPLCLGIALASGAPLFAGIIAGIIGGIVVGSLSNSPLGVSGPAAGLAVIVLNAISDLGSFEIFLVSVIIAGFLQLVMGIVKAGIIAYYFPSSVIRGMLAGIGLLIFFKQIPHAFGYDKDPEGDLEFSQQDGQNTFSELFNMFDYTHKGVMIISGVSLLILLVWQSGFIQKNKILSLVPGPLLAVISGVILQSFFVNISDLSIEKEHLVDLPVFEGLSDFFTKFTLPDFSALSHPKVYVTGVVIAVVASLETLLCVEATDKQDPHKRVTCTNTELKAQGIGNILSGFVGGLPITQVIVRSSANQQSGGSSKASAILHGIFLLISILTIPFILNKIPLATLAAILMIIGYKLAKPQLFKNVYKEGLEQFIPFITTILGIVFTDLLIGISLGMGVAIFVILRNNYKVPYVIKNLKESDSNRICIELSEDVTFLNKASVLRTLDRIPDNTMVEINASKTHFIHRDIMEIIEDFIIKAAERNIKLKLIDLYLHKELEPLPHFEIIKN